MLLTSSQVSVLISSGIVVLCTAALFFSGYAIQQRTLRDLRSAIQINRAPRPSPKIYLPDRFKRSTTELEDGTVVDVDDPRLGNRRRKLRIEQEDNDDIIVVRPTFPDEKPKQRKPHNQEKNDVDVETPKNGEDMNNQKPISRAERRQKIKEEIRRLSEGKERVYYQRRLW
ncbi:uncharacterized protein F4822DRAFT_389610 [Hypoxylon trugodes]|uniref:uncharacterized protein n=1 Tax=Hypoxylon trugodes TaxID=326681 RepID=UPI002190AA0F|nr:uncharacterized protein F4822DRAFT_389610 [Hypoxylon trugodes]KAI1392092.1 hypothetical protein F4822DRAFT_389610 [Hypoxylon trugodes]